MAAIAGAKLPDDRAIDGASIVPIFEGKKVERKTPLYWHYFRAFKKPKAAMRIGDWMVLGHWDGPMLGPGGSVHAGDSELIKKHKLVDFELYNLKDDLSQKTDQAPKRADLLRDFAHQLVDKYNKVQAEGPIWKIPARKPRPKKNAPKKK